jgi:hypothetical protein
MKKINLYIDSLYKHMDESSDEVQELKQEMKNHLLQTVNELKVEGKSEEESIEIAINRFGKRNQVENELSEVFKVQRKFATTILIVSLVSFLLAVICLISYKVIDNNFSLKVPESLQTNVEYRLKKGEVISNEEVNKLLIKYKKQFRYVALYKENNHSSPDIIYPSSFSSKEVQSDNSTLTTSVNSPDGTIWTVRYGFDIKGFNFSIKPILSISAVILLVVYWLFFGIWCVINAYHRNKLSLAWIILFFILNVVAYAIFELKRTNRLRIQAA